VERDGKSDDAKSTLSLDGVTIKLKIEISQDIDEIVTT
jgi:hypothetical protein